VHSNTNQAEYQDRLIKDAMLSNDDDEKESRRKKKNKAKVLITFLFHML
jgi:hypothetical protein